MNEAGRHRSHSEPAPRLYRVASTVLKDFKQGKDSVKNLVYAARKKHPNLKAIYALVKEAISHEKELTNAFSKIELFEKEPRFQKEMAFILFTELLYGKKVLLGTSLPITVALKYSKQITKNLPEHSDNIVNERIDFPKYARVNSLCNSLTRITKQLVQEGWLELMYDRKSTSYEGYMEMVRNLNGNEFIIDYHYESLITFPSKTQLYDHPLVEDGSLLLQDKASCLPVLCLNAPPHSKVLDACAAPGMKTSQLASSVCGNWVAALGGKQPQGAKVFAVERSAKRCGVLRTILQRSRADTVTTILNKNFLDLEPSDYSDVEYIVVDPSCSGDGMENSDKLSVSEERLNTLVFLQKKILSHALTFPNVKKVSYSTCSLTREENEEVLEEVLNHFTQWKTVKVLDSWERRGFGSKFEDCVRTVPAQDLCNAFFVSVLQKNQEHASKEDHSTKEKPKKKRRLEEEVDSSEDNSEKKRQKAVTEESLDNEKRKEENFSEKKSKKIKKAVTEQESLDHNGSLEEKSKEDTEIEESSEKDSSPKLKSKKKKSKKLVDVEEETVENNGTQKESLDDNEKSQKKRKEEDRVDSSEKKSKKKIKKAHTEQESLDHNGSLEEKFKEDTKIEESLEEDSSPKPKSKKKKSKKLVNVEEERVENNGTQQEPLDDNEKSQTKRKEEDRVDSSEKKSKKKIRKAHTEQESLDHNGSLEEKFKEDTKIEESLDSSPKPKSKKKKHKKFVDVEETVENNDTKKEKSKKKKKDKRL